MIHSNTKKAFSLLELSIVIVIIGVLLVGVIGSKHLIKKSRINAAQAITRSSPISAIKGNKLWLESSLDELSLGVSAEDFITSWKDNSSNNGLSISVEEDGPKYSNSINGVQAVKFDSTSFTNHLNIDNPEFLNGTDYTIFVLEKRMDTNDSDGGNYLLGATGSFALGYQTTSTVIQTHGEAASDGNQAAIESADAYSNKPRMISFTHSSADGNKIYINGTLANEDSSDEAKAHLAGFSSVNKLKIGKNYNGEIGELVIFDREIKNSERKEVEDYLSDKWNAPNNRDIVASCTDGTLVSTGCFSVTCTADGIGYEDKTGLAYALSSSGSFDCDTGYSGTITYTCAETGEATDISGSCSAATCTADGTGYVSKTGLAYAESGSGSFDCDAGYSGTINYTCTESGAATDITGSCIIPMIHCVGGDVTDTTSVPGYTMHIFTTIGDSDLDCGASVDGFADILVIAGGGGGGGVIGGGGGAGGLLYSASHSMSPSNYTVTVGEGGDGGNGYNTTTQGGSVGKNSIFDSLIASGGGGGAHHGSATTSSTRDGGSGGGGSGSSVPAGSGITGQGYDGGFREDSSGERQGGGGGAGSIGANGTASGAGNGGSGKDYSSAFSSNYGDSGWFSSGGGGGIRNGSGTVGTALIGGGGDGTSTSTKAGDGQANTGGGGGGAGYSGANSAILGGNGGSGIVIVRYASCPSGEVAVGGSCVVGCNVSDISGTSSANSGVSDGTVVTCNETGYDGSILGTCSGSSTITGSCGCASGYNKIGGVCKQQCTLTSAESGLESDVSITSGSTQYSCLDYGSGEKAGTLNFASACDDGSSLTVASGSCVSNIPPSCVGGDITDTTSVPGYTLHIFTTTGDTTLDCTGGSDGIAQILVVAGAGGGGGTMGGGGGAGGLLFDSAYDVSSTIYNLTIGDGGDGGTGYGTANQGGSTGKDSIFDVSGTSLTMTSSGGGAGCHYAGAATTTENDGIGGSGGGTGSGHECTSTGIVGQGHNGGTHNPSDGSGGGGGAGSAGGTSDDTGAGNGGAGLDYSSEFSANYGESGWFASGGGGGIRNTNGTPAGTSPLGGGGDGTADSSKAGDGQANTGGGGGGAGYHSSTSSILGGKGGSGIIIIKYLTDAP